MCCGIVSDLISVLFYWTFVSAFSFIIFCWTVLMQLFFFFFKLLINFKVPALTGFTQLVWLWHKGPASSLDPCHYIPPAVATSKRMTSSTDVIELPFTEPANMWAPPASSSVRSASPHSQPCLLLMIDDSIVRNIQSNTVLTLDISSQWTSTCAWSCCIYWYKLHLISTIRDWFWLSFCVKNRAK